MWDINQLKNWLSKKIKIKKHFVSKPKNKNCAWFSSKESINPYAKDLKLEILNKSSFSNNSKS